MKIQVRFINLIPMHFFVSHYITPSVFHHQLQGNQCQETLKRALEHIHSLLLRLPHMFVIE